MAVAAHTLGRYPISEIKTEETKSNS
jgi:hypothetical protein